MNINKKFDRMKQWAGEMIGNETKTAVSEDFKLLEVEMNLRHEGMEKLQKSMTSYVKSLSKRNEGDDREKVLPVAYLGQTMIHHGEDFEPDSEFGGCLIAMGRTNERIARIQESYVVSATTEWLESLERSLAQMKEYQAARKKLDGRRLAYDTSITKMQKAKREDFRIEEELRAQKAKYEESSEDVLRRMQDVKEAEADSIRDLTAFLDAELEYYDRCRDELLRLKREWPASITSTASRNQRQGPRSRSNTAYSYSDRLNINEEPTPEPEPVRPSIRSNGRVPSSSRIETTTDYSPDSPPRPSYGRAATFQGPTSIYRETTPVNSRVPSIANDAASLRSQLRPTTRVNTNNDLFADPSDDSTVPSTSPDLSYGERSVSPATSYGSTASRSNSYSAAPIGRKGPPPPPPSRTKKPPPPPPMKRSEFSSASVSRA